MRVELRSRHVLLFVTSSLAALGTNCLAAEDVVLPRPVTDALARYGELKAFSIKWTQHFSFGPVARAKFGPDMVTQVSSPCACYLVWKTQRMYYGRYDGTREWKSSRNSGVQEVAFDGRIIASGSHLSDGKPRPALRIDLLEDVDADADYFAVRPFQTMGIRLPQRAGDLLQVKKLQSQLLFLLAHGGQLKTIRQVEINGRKLMQVAVVVSNPARHLIEKSSLPAGKEEPRDSRNDGTGGKDIGSVKRSKGSISGMIEHVFYLDPALGYSVRRWRELTEDGRLRAQSDCDGHQKLDGYEIWVPRNCQIDYYMEGDKGEPLETPFQSLVVRVVELGTTPVPDEQFSLRRNVVGAMVTDNSLSESKQGKGPVTYMVPADPEDLDRAIEQARALTQMNAAGERWLSSSQIVFIILNGIALSVLLVYLVIRARRKA